MKKIKLFVLALAAMSVVACQKDAGKIDAKEGVDNATLTLSLTTAESKAISDATIEQESKIKDLTVFMIKADGSVIGKFIGTPLPINTITGLPSTVGQVYVVANVGNLSGVCNTRSDVESLSRKLAAGTGNLPTQVGTEGLWMSGSAPILWNTEGTAGIATGNVTIQLGFVAAKIIVEVDASGITGTIGADPVANDVSFERVSLIYAGQDGKFFGNQSTQTTFYKGLLSRLSPNGGEYVAFLGENLTTLTKTVSQKSYFYAFGNDGKTAATLINVHVRTDIDVEGEFKDRYFVAALNKADLGGVIEPGNVYNVTLKFKGDFTATNPGGSTPDPEDPKVLADVSIEVKPAKWVGVLNYEKVFKD